MKVDEKKSLIDFYELFYIILNVFILVWLFVCLVFGYMIV